MQKSFNFRCIGPRFRRLSLGILRGVPLGPHGMHLNFPDIGARANPRRMVGYSKVLLFLPVDDESDQKAMQPIVPPIADLK